MATKVVPLRLLAGTSARVVNICGTYFFKYFDAHAFTNLWIMQKKCNVIASLSWNYVSFALSHEINLRNVGHFVVGLFLRVNTLTLMSDRKMHQKDLAAADVYKLSLL